MRRGLNGDTFDFAPVTVRGREKSVMRPGDERGFIHKKIGKFASGLVRTGLGVVGGLGIPGVSGAARIGRSILRGGSRDQQFLDARRQAFTRQRRFLVDGRLPAPGGILGAVTGTGVIPIAGAPAAAEGSACPKGFHLNKTGYYIKKQNLYVEEKTRCVKNRRRNPDNGSASMRAARRLLGRKKHQDRIDRALASIAPRRRSRSQKPSTAGRQTIVAT